MSGVTREEKKKRHEKRCEGRVGNAKPEAIHGAFLRLVDGFMGVTGSTMGESWSSAYERED